jgi:hypothetical protein
LRYFIDLSDNDNVESSNRCVKGKEITKVLQSFHFSNEMSTFINKMKNESDKRFQVLEKGLRDLIEQVNFFLKLFHDLI